GRLQPGQLFLYVGDHRLLLIDLCGGLIALVGEDIGVYPRQHLSFMHAVAFLLYAELYHFTRNVGTDLDLFFGIYLTAGGDDLRDIPADDFLRRNPGALVLSESAGLGDHDDNHDQEADY